MTNIQSFCLWSKFTKSQMYSWIFSNFWEIMCTYHKYCHPSGQQDWYLKVQWLCMFTRTRRIQNIPNEGQNSLVKLGLLAGEVNKVHSLHRTELRCLLWFRCWVLPFCSGKMGTSGKLLHATWPGPSNPWDWVHTSSSVLTGHILREDHAH